MNVNKIINIIIYKMLKKNNVSFECLKKLSISPKSHSEIVRLKDSSKGRTFAMVLELGNTLYYTLIPFLKAEQDQAMQLVNKYYKCLTISKMKNNQPCVALERVA